MQRRLAGVTLGLALLAGLPAVQAQADPGPPQEEGTPSGDPLQPEPEQGPRVLLPIDPPEGEQEITTEQELSVGFGARIDLVLASFDGHLQREQGKQGSRINLDKDLVFDSHAPGYAVSAWLRLGDFVVAEGGYLQIESKRTGVADTSLNWLGLFQNPGERIKTEYSLEIAYAGARIMVLRERWIDLGFPVGVLWNEQTLTLRHQGAFGGFPNKPKASGSVQVWTPYAGVQLDATFTDRFGSLGAQARFTGFAYGADTIGHAFFALETYLTYGYEDYVRVFVGPRVFLQAHSRESENHDEDRKSWIELYSLSFGIQLGF